MTGGREGGKGRGRGEEEREEEGGRGKEGEGEGRRGREGEEAHISHNSLMDNILFIKLSNQGSKII